MDHSMKFLVPALLTRLLARMEMNQKEEMEEEEEEEMEEMDGKT